MCQVEAILGALTIRPLESDVERVYAAIRVALEKKGRPIGAHDMSIAAHIMRRILVEQARAHGAAKRGAVPDPLRARLQRRSH